MTFDTISTWLAPYWGWLSAHTLSVQLIAIIVATYVVIWVKTRLLRSLLRQTKKSQNRWDDTLIQAATLPITLLIWLMAISIASDALSQAYNLALFTHGSFMREVGFIVLLVLFISRFISGGEQTILDKQAASQDPQRMDTATIRAMAKLMRLAIYIVAFLILLQAFGYSISGILAFGGIGGIAIGFAAKDLLANFFGGLIIYLDKPFQIGDWIRSPDREIEGTVEDIGWRITRIRTFDKRPLYVPNSVFTTVALENPSRMTNRRIRATIGLRYQDVDKMDAITSEVRQYLRQHNEIDQTQTLMVEFDAFNASSIDFFIYTFTKTTNWVEFHQIKHRILLDIAHIIEKNGAEIAFPTRQLMVKKEPSLPDMFNS